jgi:hypothetical protein
MAWTDSRIFRSYLVDQVSLATTTKINLASDSIKNALFGTTPTPDRNVTNTLSGYNASTSQWVVANEVSQVTNWPAGGVALTGQSVNSATANTVFFSASPTVSGATFTTSSAAFGSLIYDTTATTVTNQGICFLYFGGANSVTNGTFTCAYAASPSGIFNIVV